MIAAEQSGEEATPVGQKRQPRHQSRTSSSGGESRAHGREARETKIPKIAKEEEDMLVNAVVQHSDKEAASDEPLVELLKDVDSLDRYLHGVKTEGAYLERCNRVLRELGIEPQANALESQ